ncbi:ribbon-helix-helix domain-containing protein [Haloplanus natans]|uniref:ribbon-helix-helix domain-containing protein n=1 Tax=Haloplanus natans TaxID=376171 RepID=UPI000677DBB4|nr:transcriptional regulator [Haloplanus natans]
MVKSTVRFPAEVLDAVQNHVDDGEFANQSEFQRFAVEYLLDNIEEDYDPTLAEYNEIRTTALNTDSNAGSDGSVDTRGDDYPDFLQTAARVRQYAVRGDADTAYELIDTYFPPESSAAMLLDHVVRGVQSDMAATDGADESTEVPQSG